MTARILLLFALAGFTGCAEPEPPVADADPGEPVLTPEAAREAALLARMRAGGPPWFDADWYAGVRLEERDDGWHSFGSFRINPAARKYEFVFSPPPPNGIGKTPLSMYEGTFSLRAGVWVADPPREVLEAGGG